MVYQIALHGDNSSCKQQNGGPKKRATSEESKANFCAAAPCDIVTWVFTLESVILKKCAALERSGLAILIASKQAKIKTPSYRNPKYAQFDQNSFVDELFKGTAC